MGKSGEIIHHIDEIDTSNPRWAFGIEKVRSNGTVYRVERDPYSNDVHLIDDEA